MASDSPAAQSNTQTVCCRLLLEQPDFSAEQKLGFIKARSQPHSMLRAHQLFLSAHCLAAQGCQQLYLSLQASLEQHLASFRDTASQGPLQLPPEALLEQVPARPPA